MLQQLILFEKLVHYSLKETNQTDIILMATLQIFDVQQDLFQAVL